MLVGEKSTEHSKSLGQGFLAVIAFHGKAGGSQVGSFAFSLDTAAVLSFFNAGLLYLCFEHVDNLGAYTASRPETGLLIPSGYQVSESIMSERRWTPLKGSSGHCSYSIA